MKPLLERIADGEILISDGAIGTFLQAKGLQPGESPELWCITHPDAVKSVAEAYIAAGSDIVETDSFGGTSFKQTKFGLEERVVEMNRAAAKLARDAMGDRGYVAASVGPTGRIAYDEGGNTTNEDLYNAFKEQVVALEEGGADAVCIETMMSVIEAVQAVKATKENTGLTVICTFTFEPGARGFRTMMGVTPGDAALAVVEAGADIIGANCGNGIENMIEITRQIRAAAPNTPILIQANAGVPVLEGGRTIFKATPEEMAAHVPELIEAGANIVGGCCGTTPEHIAAIAGAARGFQKLGVRS
ncbi:MAG: homocysteine S-methyltransferase family protein [Armatimonadetes bacterium]|nr:homocysteine S-methyltransferase family protein [Armatimonadota bacterium]